MDEAGKVSDVSKSLIIVLLMATILVSLFGTFLIVDAATNLSMNTQGDYTVPPQESKSSGVVQIVIKTEESPNSISGGAVGLTITE